MAKALKVAAVVAGVAALAVVTGGAALGLGLALSTTAFGVSAGALLAASAVLSTAGSLLAPKPKAPSTSSASTDRLNVSVNVQAPRTIVLGRTAMATDLRDQEWSSDQTYLHRFIVVASHKVAAIREIWLDDKLAWTSAAGGIGEFAPWLVVVPVLEGSAANAINLGPRMGASRRFTGLAYVYLRFQILANSKKLDSVFNQSVPSRMTIVGDGAATYDPRLDSTVPGGSGPMRAEDQSTWAWNDDASRNPALAMLFYLLGWRINGVLAVGKGIPPARIDLASFITAANLCDEPVARSAGGNEPRYRCDGIFSEADDPSLVLDNLKATMNAVLDDADGRLRLTVLHNDLAAPIGELVTGDVLGDFTWNQTASLSDAVNVIRGGYVDPSPASLYQLVDYPEVRIASPDGIDRSQTVNLPLVQSASQAQRLVKQRLQRMLYGGTFTAEFQATAWKFQKGDVIRFTFAALGWSQKLFRIADMAIQVDGRVPMVLREEHPAIYAWDASDAAPVAGAAPTTYDASLWPIAQGVAEAGTTAEWDNVSDPNGTRPEDNATVGAPTGTDVAGRPAEDVVAQIDDLIETYGDTVAAGEFAEAAAASAAAADLARANSEAARDQSAAARDLSQSAATAAQTAREGAEVALGGADAASASAQSYRDQAATSASNASGSAGQASEQAGVAAAAATEAGNRAGAAAGSASSASASADAAGSSASAAQGSAADAATRAGEASASAGQAATSRDEAGGFAASAASSSTVAAGARDAAQGHAQAASTSASSAAASESAAGQSASAASGSATLAGTRAGQAQTYRDEAATSASNASGSASTASQQAGLAAGSASAAGGSATAAQSSAGIASTKADEAGASATVASTARQDAVAARDGAQSSAGSAAGSAGVASGHAAAALEYRNTTATYRDEAAGSASSASLSAQAASTTAAQVDQNVGAIAQRVDSVEATANGAAASASQSAAAVAGINGQLATRVVTEAVTPGGRAQVKVYSSSNGGAGVDMIGDVRFFSDKTAGVVQIADTLIRMIDPNGIARVEIGNLP